MKLAVSLLSVILAMTMLLPAFSAVEIIIDNPGASFVGSWQTGTSSKDKYGSDYRFAGQSLTTGKSVTYTPDIPSTAGDWAVYTWYPEGTGRPLNAQYIIHTAAGDDIKYVNQQTNGGKWVYVGTYTMAAGTGNYVQIMNYGADTTKTVMADGIRFYSETAGAGHTTPPVITLVSAAPGETAATITWTTDELATSQVEYGLTTLYGSQTVKDSTLTLNHSVNITGLSPLTSYHFRVKSADSSSNEAVSGDYTVTTTVNVSPVISAVSSASGESTAAITWTTDKQTTSQVEYGLTTSYGSLTTKDALLKTSHTVNISGLTPQTGYHYRVLSEDSLGSGAVSGDYAFTTTASVPPVVSNISALPGDTSASISWTTDESTTSQVEYGITASYGNVTTKDTSPVTSHTVNMTGLTPTTIYHYRVKSEDAVGNLTVSGDNTVTTTAQLLAEYRALWVDTWHAGIFSTSQITNLVNMCNQSNYNIIIPEVRKCGDAYYVSSYEPKANNFTGSFDPLADIITKAHAVGMQVHPWIVTYRIWNSGWAAPPANHIWSLHPDWALTDVSGGITESGYYILDPGVPGAQDYICKVVMDIVTRYNVDGINFDYIRYPGTNWGYNAITKERFKQEYGYYPPTSSSDPNWDVWCDYRRQQVTDLVKKCYLNIMAVKPGLHMSVDSVAWMGADPSTDFEGTSQYDQVYQDSKSWMEQHIVDSNMLMNYKRDYDTAQAADYALWTNWLAAMQTFTGRHGLDGQGNYLNSISGSVHQMQMARGAGIGIVNYNYATTNKDSQPTADFFNGVKANAYPTRVGVPDMPWKTNPTTGIIFGTVTNAAKPNDPVYQNWVYKATVTATGPGSVTQTTTTDATGTYGFIDLPVGTYSISVSKTGFPTRTYTGQKINAGDVLREDFDLGYVTATAPAGTVTGEYNWISFPLEPVNLNPVSVLPGIRLDGRLYRFTNSNQSQDMYDEYMPDYFGNLKMDEGYTLLVDAPYAISYQAWAGSPAMADISLPVAGLAFISCPLNRIVPWDQVLVTKNGVTVDMHTAKANNWLCSTAFWWDSPTQRMYDIGLPEDWPGGGTALKPWYAYWLETYTDGLTLTLK